MKRMLGRDYSQGNERRLNACTYIEYVVNFATVTLRSMYRFPLTYNYPK